MNKTLLKVSFLASVFLACIYIGKVDGKVFAEESIFKQDSFQEIKFSEDFFEISKIDKRKHEFVKTMLPLIEKTNHNILKEREIVVSYFEKKKSSNEVSQKETEAIISIAKRYKITSVENEEEFLKRVAPIPISLALTQAALESGWGKSRFIKEANNIFGQWTWSQKEGAGIVPENRKEGMTHSIRVFKTLQDSTDAYALNLNRNSAYKDFREARAEYKENFTGLLAAETMHNYSEIKGEYVALLKQVMTKNKFLAHDQSYTSSPKA